MKRFHWIGLSALLLVGLLSIYLLLWHKGIPSRSSEDYFYLSTGSEKTDLFNKIREDQDIWSQWSLPIVAQLMRFDNGQVKPGRYHWQQAMSNLEFLRMIRSGRQKPVQLVVFRTLDMASLAGLAGRYLEPDSLDFLEYLSDPAVYQAMGYNRDNFLTLFIPNTYEFYWNTSPEALPESNEKRTRKLLDRSAAPCT